MTNENYENLTNCPVLKAHIIKFMKMSDQLLDQEDTYTEEWFENIRLASLENRIEGFQSLKIYQKFSKKLQTDFSFSNGDAIELVNKLELLAIGYLGLTQSRVTAYFIKCFRLECLDLSKKLNELANELPQKIDIYEFFLSLLSYANLDVKEHTDAFNSLIKASEILKQLPDKISHSPFAKSLEFNKAAKVTNWALYIWVENLYAYWVNGLGRTIRNSNDGINGRKPLLEFLLFCIEPLHEAIEYDTLDNMLRKVQRDVKKRGGLSDPNFQLGSSSPFGVDWRSFNS